MESGDLSFFSCSLALGREEGGDDGRMTVGAVACGAVMVASMMVQRIR